MRAGLIGGPGDHTDRSGAWVARAACDPHTPMLVPDTAAAVTQVVDVRDLGAWTLACAVDGRTGTYHAVGPVVPFEEWVTMFRQVGGHDGPVVLADAAWLLAQGVEEYRGAASLAMWLAGLGFVGWSSGSDAAALKAGLIDRPREVLLPHVLAWERDQGLDRARAAGGVRRESRNSSRP